MLVVYARAIVAVRRRYLLSWGASFLGDDSSGRLIRAAFWGYGGLLSLMTLTGVGAERHYMIVIAPLMSLSVARLATLPTNGLFTPAARALLAVSCAGQLLVSALLLNYIHQAQVLNPPYGATWAAQQKGLAPGSPLLEVPPKGCRTPSLPRAGMDVVRGTG